MTSREFSPHERENAERWITDRIQSVIPSYDPNDPRVGFSWWKTYGVKYTAADKKNIVESLDPALSSPTMGSYRDRLALRIAAELRVKGINISTLVDEFIKSKDKSEVAFLADIFIKTASTKTYDDLDRLLKYELEGESEEQQLRVFRGVSNTKPFMKNDRFRWMSFDRRYKNLYNRRRGESQ